MFRLDKSNIQSGLAKATSELERFSPYKEKIQGANY
jgi:hypothetical protein